MSLFERSVRAAISRGRLLWICALLLAVPATYRTVRLYAHLQADIEALLPRTAPSVKALEEFRQRMAGLSFLGVVVDTGEATRLRAGEAFLDALEEELRSYPPELVRGVAVGREQEKEFLTKNAPLYLDVDDLTTIRDRLAERRDYEVSKGAGLRLDDEDDDTPPTVDFSDIERRVRARLPASEPRSDGGDSTRFSSEKLHTTLLLIEAGSFDRPSSTRRTLLERVKADVQRLTATGKLPPEARVGYTGDIAVSVEETEALMADLSLSSVVVLALVIAVIWLYFRWLRSIPLLLGPLLLATMFAFAVASLPPFGVTELNSNTAFLGSIVVGNGINFGIMLLSRYVEERRLGVLPYEAMVVAARDTKEGTLGAALAAGCAYLALAVTDFQGFRQFGFIGGLGMGFSWLAAYYLLPALTLTLDTAEHRHAPSGRWVSAAFAGIARWVERVPRAITGVAVAATLVSVVVVAERAPESLEVDMSRLRRADTWQQGEGYWGRKMDALLGTYLTPMVVLTDGAVTTREAKQVLDALIAEPELSELLSHTHAMDDVLPRRQAEKIAIVEETRQILSPRVRAAVPAEQRELLDRFVATDRLSPLRPEDLPRSFTRGLREHDGRIDEVVLIVPRTTRALWDGHRLDGMIGEVRAALQPLGEGRSPRLAGSLPVSADILSSLGRDGPRATLAALGGVVLVVLFLFRRTRYTLLVLGTLTAGVLWLAASTLGFGMKINFANFIAFPITLGIGVDYVVNLLTRYRLGGPKPVESAICEAGRAVALCSLTTVIGYSSLLLAENRALFLFGVMSVIGEAACTTTAIIVAPALLVLSDRRAAARA